MKKITIFLISMLFLGVTLTTAMPSTITKNQPIALLPTFDGSFEGTIGPKPHDNKTIGNISGTYETRNRGGRFNGEWEISLQNTSKSGTVRGIFFRIFVLGKVTIEGINRTVPIVGFIKAKDGTFVGRWMAPVGPAFYFWGTYT